MNKIVTMQTQFTPTHLRQRHFLFGVREFTLKDPHTLLVREHSLSRHHETQIPVALLHPSPTYSSSFSIKWLLHSLFMGSLSGLLFYWAYTQQFVVLYAPASILAGTTLVMVYRFFLYTTRLIIFRHTNSNENLLYIWLSRPSRAEAEQFAHILSQTIYEQTSPPEQPRTGSLSLLA